VFTQGNYLNRFTGVGEHPGTVKKSEFPDEL
jgi:hypothetical protein